MSDWLLNSVFFVCLNINCAAQSGLRRCKVKIIKGVGYQLQNEVSSLLDFHRGPEASFRRGRSHTSGLSQETLVYIQLRFK